MKEEGTTKLEDPSLASGFRYMSQIRKLRCEKTLKPLYEQHVKQSKSKPDAAGSGVTLTCTGYGVYVTFNSPKDGPALNNDGDALTDGLLYFNTSDDFDST